MRLLGMTPRPKFGYRGYLAVADGTKRTTLRERPLVVGAEYMLTTGTRFRKGGPERTGIVVRVTETEMLTIKHEEYYLPRLLRQIGIAQNRRDYERPLLRAAYEYDLERFAIADGFEATKRRSAGENFSEFLWHVNRYGIPPIMYLAWFEVVRMPGEVADETDLRTQ